MKYCYFSFTVAIIGIIIIIIIMYRTIQVTIDSVNAIYYTIIIAIII